MNRREGIRGQDYYDLKRKLWVEAMCAGLTRYCPERAPYSAKDAAKLADEAIEEFTKRFQACI